jgi:hypothetical protein
MSNIYYTTAMSVVSVRVPRELKEKMRKYRDKINWSEEIRRFIENKILEAERENTLSRLEELINQLPTVPRGTAVRYVREDRDGN